MVVKRPSYDLRPCDLGVVAEMVKKYHGYGSISKSATYTFAVYEDGNPVASFAWQPPPVGAAKNVCPEAPSSVLALSRMVAVPKDQRKLNHISKPLRRQMKNLIDRTLYPVLITVSDKGQGHTGHVYKCSGWQKTIAHNVRFYLNPEGNRASSYSNGKHGLRNLTFGGITVIQRWEHHICERGKALEWLTSHGWKRIILPNKVWKSGNQAYTWRNDVQA